MGRHAKVANFMLAQERERRKERRRKWNRVLHGIFVIPFAVTIALMTALLVQIFWEGAEVQYRLLVTVLIVAAVGLILGTIAELALLLVQGWDKLAPCMNRNGENTTKVDTEEVALTTIVVAVMAHVLALVLDASAWVIQAGVIVGLFMVMLAEVFCVLLCIATRGSEAEIAHRRQVYDETGSWRKAILVMLPKSEEAD